MYGYCLAGLAVHNGANRFIKCSNYLKTNRVSTKDIGPTSRKFEYINEYGSVHKPVQDGDLYSFMYSNFLVRVIEKVT